MNSDPYSALRIRFLKAEYEYENEYHIRLGNTAFIAKNQRELEVGGRRGFEIENAQHA
jgi:hypothetical protein